MKKSFLHYYFIIVAILFSACKQSNNRLFEKLSSASTGITFSNIITENDSVNILTYYYCYNGGGVGVADFNNDGLQDVFFTANMVSSKLYLNKGKMQFEDVTTASGLSTHDWIMGVSVVDINNDGWMDIYLNVAGPNRKNHHNLLFINQHAGNGVITFREEAAGYGLADSSFCVQSAFFDYDRDGDLDMYLLTNDVDGVEKTFVNPASYPITRGVTVDRLYENVGDSLGHPFYKNVSKQAGITEEGYGLGLAIDDLNADGWPDIYAANDFMPNDQLLINQRNKTFRESAAQSMCHQTYNGMGVDIADINNDMKPDIMVLDMLPENNERRKTMIARTDYESFVLRQKAGYVDEYMRNTLQLNQGTDAKGITHFSDIAQLAGLHATDWSWSVLLADFDNDGFRDSYVTNGFAKNITDLDFLSYNADNNTFGSAEDKIKRTRELFNKLKGVKVSNYIFKNKGTLAFENMTDEWGIKNASYSNGAAYADLDNDGDLDLITNNINEEAFIYENIENDNKNKNNFLKVTLKGSDKNITGVGASISVYCGNDKFYSYYSPVRGYLSSMASPLSFGLGKHPSIDSLKITWADGKEQVIRNVKVNQQLKLDYKASQPVEPANITTQPVFTNVNDTYNIHFKHIENDYNDFNDESLLPKLYSRKGPGIAVGDIDNENGLDFFIGGSAGNAGSLFIQKKNSSFLEKKINLQDAKYEDMGSLFFDADGDGDEDLYVVSGGNEFKNTPGAYQDRLYINDNKGNFTKNEQSLPVTVSSGSCVVGADFDKDGDIDLFRGGANVPGSYPESPRSYLLKNENGKFVDITSEAAPELVNIGMVNSAVWSDFDNDGWMDLIVVGEWMPPVFLKNQKGKLVNVTKQTGLSNVNGWWNSIYPADIDNDGDMDFVVGNMGTNIDYKPAKNQPVELFYNNFNGSNRKEPLLSCYIKNESGEKRRYPFAYRDDLFRVMPTLKKKFWNYETYSKATLNEVFKADELSKAKHYQADIFESCIIKNNGNGKFSISPLPAEAQLSCINGIMTTDFDKDGNIDIIVSGNSHSTEVVYGHMDASLGVLLKGDGKGNFSAVSSPTSGLFLKGDMKSLASLFDKDGNEIILAAANSDSLQALHPSVRETKKVFYAKPGDVYAEIIYKNGKKRKQEFYYGAGYLSQSARALEIDKLVNYIEVVDSKDNKRRISFS
ncbi:VCBS repeat-containing protein [Segetibacter koreensis]|uniref:VCBS repeat-containing protein n=1 Tax=Segetibacter koreensis TaxID=398037 RepID=UPI00037B18A7|nr:VCBS repeat-containing protein [Segetibacter koreensis]